MVGASARIGASYFFLFTTVAVVAPHLQVLLRGLGFGPAAVGMLLGVYEVSAIVGAIPAGRVADSTRRTGAVIQVCLAVASAALALVTRWGGGRTLVAVACMVGAGLTFKNSIPLTDALASRTLRDAHHYGRVRVLGSLGYIATSFAVQIFGWVRADRPVTILATSAVASGVYALALFFLPRPGREAAPTPHPATVASFRAVLTPTFLAFLGIAFLTLLGTSAHYSFFSLFLTERFGLTAVSGIWAIGSAAEIPMIFFSGVFLRRFGVRKLLAAAGAAVTLRLLIYAAAPGLPLVIAAQLLHLLTFGAFHTASVAAVRRLVPAEHQGLGMAVYSGLCSGLALLAGSVLGGLVLEHAAAAGADPFRVLYLLFALPPAVAAALAIVSLRSAALGATKGAA